MLWETLPYPMGASQVAIVVRNPPANAGDAGDSGSIPGSGRYPEGGNGNPLQYSCLKRIPRIDKPGGLHSTQFQKSQASLRTEHTCKTNYSVKK